MHERPTCPACDEGTLRPIVYGLVQDGKLRERADRGAVMLGGCQVGQDSPEWECPECETRYQADPVDRGW